MKLVLASASPRRKKILERLPIELVVMPSDVDENISPDRAECFAQKLAELKARSVFEKSGILTLGADTVVEKDGEILGKPHSVAEAKEMFGKLCGGTHRVVTGFCITDGVTTVTDFDVTYVTFGFYDETIVNDYIKSGSPFDKAGGYGIQDELLRPLIENINGDIDNVIGLPLKKVTKVLKEKFGSWI